MKDQHNVEVAFIGKDKISAVLKSVNTAARQNFAALTQATRGLRSNASAMQKTAFAARRLNRVMKTATTQMGRFAIANRQAIKNAGQWSSLRITAPLILAAGYSLKAAAAMERYDLALTTMYGSAKTAKAVLADLVNFASTTPFYTQEVVAAGQKLTGFGIKQEELMDTMRRIGDLASGTTNRTIQDLAHIHGKILSKGKLQAEEMLHLVEGGIPIVETLIALEKESGRHATAKDIYHLGHRGLLTNEKYLAAFRRLTDEGGRYYNLTESLSKALGGLWSTTVSKVWEVSAAAGAVLERVYNIKENLRATNAWLDNTKHAIETADAATQRWAVGLITAAGAFAPMTIALAAVLAILNAIGSKATIIAGIIVGVGTAAAAAAGKINVALDEGVKSKAANAYDAVTKIIAAREAVANITPGNFASPKEYVVKSAQAESTLAALLKEHPQFAEMTTKQLRARKSQFNQFWQGGADNFLKGFIKTTADILPTQKSMPLYLGDVPGIMQGGYNNNTAAPAADRPAFDGVNEIQTSDAGVMRLLERIAIAAEKSARNPSRLAATQNHAAG